MRLLLLLLLCAGCQDWYDPDWIPCYTDDNCDGDNVCVGGGSIEDTVVGACHSIDDFEDVAADAIFGWQRDEDSGFDYGRLAVGDLGLDCGDLADAIVDPSGLPDVPWLHVTLIRTGDAPWEALFGTSVNDLCVKGATDLTCILQAQLLVGAEAALTLDAPEMSVRLSEVDGDDLRGTFYSTEEGLVETFDDPVTDFNGLHCGELGDIPIDSER